HVTRTTMGAKENGRLSMTPQEVMPVMRCHPVDGCRTSSKRTWDERSRWLLLVVGLGGLEPPASSLSGIEGSALCGPAFSQVTAERQGRRDAFLATLFQAVQANQVTLAPCPGEDTIANPAPPWRHLDRPDPIADPLLGPDRNQEQAGPSGPADHRNRSRLSCWSRSGE